MTGSHPETKKPLARGAKYSKREVVELKAIFDSHDKDKDGRVTVQELMAGMTSDSKHVTSKAASSAFKVLDINKDGKITWTEYIDAIYPLATAEERKIMISWGLPVKEQPKPEKWKPSEEQLEEIKVMFGMFDDNHSGRIELPELLKSAYRCGYDPEEMEALFKLHDKDANGYLDFAEFVDMLEASYI